VLKEIHLQKIQLLSDTDLYQQAVEFMQRFEQAKRRTLPSTQMHGLLDISHAESYPLLQQFVQHQYKERVWQRGKEYIGEFFKELDSELSRVRQYAKSIAHQSKDRLSLDEEWELTMLLAREFIQHLVAENAYIDVKRRAEREAEGHAQGGGHQRDNRDRQPQRGR
jgi:hypothetical protein